MATTDHIALRVSDHAASRELFTRVFELLESSGQPYDGALAPRPEYGHDYYGAFVLDTDR